MTGSAKEAGAAAVEMAIVASLLLLLVAGIVDVGRVLYTYIGVQDAAQEGAIFGAYNPGQQAKAEARARESTDFPDLTAGGSVNVSYVDGGCTVESEVTYDVDLLTPAIAQILGSPLTISRTFTGEVFDGTNCA